MTPKKTTEVEEFLRESNAIERVYDDKSLENAKYAWGYLMDHDTITIHIVKRVHSILMYNHLPHPDLGTFRNIMVYIGGKPAINPLRILERMNQWCAAMVSTNPTHNSKDLHVMYEGIHPFVDGNGRTGRIFMNWHRLKITQEPLLIIHEGNEQQKYYEWFQKEN